MTSPKNDNNVLKELRKIRKKHFEETKNMTMAERMEYHRQKSERFREEISKIDAGKYDFPFLHSKKEKT
ncbi:MAG: hypothetical protein LBU34_15405 [Planctomycetaceae bacterium]|jgi:hypothetical protein|nr:hypothetical protein [Planctomycetaceae bacterium]